MAKNGLIPVVVASCVIALCSAVSLCSCTAKDGVNLHVGNDSLNVDTPLLKVDKAGKDDKVHVHIPQIDLETK